MGSASDFYAQYLLDSLSQLGVTGLPDWQGLEPGRVDIGVLDQAWQLGLDQIGPDVALRVGALVTPRAIDVLGYASMARRHSAAPSHLISHVMRLSWIWLTCICPWPHRTPLSKR